MSSHELFRAAALPAYQNKMFDTGEAAKQCPTGDVVLVQDSDTGLVFNDAYDPEKLHYDQTYQNEQGLSTAFQMHINAVLDKVDRNFEGERILEVGCGKGTFLDLVRLRGHDAIGIDPAYEGTASYIHKRHFDSTLEIKAGAIILRHVLEHIPQPLAFLKSITEANGGSGKIYIEVPCLDWILQRNAWFDIFYEHVNYFRLSDFENMFREVREMGHLFDGQYIYVVADLDSLRDSRDFNSIQPALFPSDFLSVIDELATTKSNASTRAVWGAAAKGVMFAHHLMARGLRLDFAIDINPAKQGKFLANSALPVLSPEVGLSRLSAGDDIFVMNSNYLNEISAVGGNTLNYILADKQ